MQVTLGAPTELTGKRFVLKNQDDESEVEFFSYLSYKPDETMSLFRGLELLFPAQAWSAPLQVNLASTNIPRTTYIAIQNPNIDPVEVLGQTIPGGGLTTMGFPWQFGRVLSISSSGPIRVLDLIDQPTFPGYAFSPVYPSPPTPPIVIPQTQVTANPASLSWEWQIESPAPPSRTLALTTNPRERSSNTRDCFRRLVVIGCLQPRFFLAYHDRKPVGADSRQLSSDDHRGRGIRPGIPRPILLPFRPAVDNSGFADRNPDPDTLAHRHSRTPEFQRRLPRTSPALADCPCFRKWRSREVFSRRGPALGVGESFRCNHTGRTYCLREEPAKFLPCVGCLTGNIVITGPENDVIVPVSLDISGIYAEPESLTFSLKAGSPPQTQTVKDKDAVRRVQSALVLFDFDQH